jgi:uncharacterized protein
MMSKKILLPLLLFLFCFSTESYSQLLWKITGKKLKKPSYLYGTIHVADERAFIFKDQLLAKLGECDAYAGEMIFDPQMIFELLPKLFMGKDTTLQTLLNEAEYKIVKEALNDKLGMMSSFAERMKPIFTSFLLQEGSMESTQTKSKEKVYDKPLDLFLQEEAGKRKLELIGLETLEEQMNVFDLMPVQKQAKALYQEIVSVTKDTANTDMDKMLDWYAAQKLDSLYQYASQEFKENPELGYRILTKRNQNMTERIEALILKKSVLIAIGAAHLPDIQGVIELLKKKKFKVVQVKTKQ